MSKYLLHQLNISEYAMYNKSNLPIGWNVTSRGDLSSHSGKYGRMAWICEKDGMYSVGVATADGVGESDLYHETVNFAEALAYGDAWVKAKVRFR